MSGKIVTFVTMKGGTGKSTICLSLAHALQKNMGMKVAIVDSDYQQATSLGFYGLRRITANEPEIAAKKYDMSFPEVAQVTPSTPYRKQLARVAEFYDIVLVDTKGEFTPFQLDLLRMSDYILMPVGASKLDVDPTKLVREAVAQENTQREDKEKMGISYIMSRVDDSANSLKHMTDEITRDGFHVMNESIPTTEFIVAISGLGFTFIDAAEATYMCSAIVNKQRERHFVSFKKKQVCKLNDAINDIAKQLVGRLK